MSLIISYDREVRLREMIVKHTNFLEAINRVAECHDFTTKTKKSTYLLILGEPGVGKTTLLRTYAERYPRISRGRVDSVPVLSIEIPPSPSLVSLLNTFLAAYSDAYTYRSRPNIGDMTKQLITLMKAAGTTAVLIDELQNFMTQASQTQVKALAALLKTLMNQVSVSLIAAGTPESLRLVNADDQLRSRMSAEVWIKPFNIDGQEGYDIFRKTLVSVEKTIELASPSFLYKSPLAERIYYACDGRFRHLITLLSNAIRLAETQGCECITIDLLHAAFLRSFRSDTPDRDNPFSETFIPRRLISRGEAHGERAAG